MLATERHAHILAEIRRKGAVRVSELARSLDVSEMTIRRDLDVLADEEPIRKVHGGATLPRAPSTEEPGFEAKRARRQAEKEAIAQAVRALVEPGMSLGISAGTTTWTLARNLTGIADLTVVTNSIRIADVLHRASTSAGIGPAVILTGGVRTPSDALVGPLAVASLRDLHLDVAILGVHGLDPEAGFTTPNIAEAETDRALVASARRLVVVADHTKWRTVGLATIADLDDADVVVTDSGLPSEAHDELSARVREVVLATP